jgi:hypothetical protein
MMNWCNILTARHKQSAIEGSDLKTMKYWKCQKKEGLARHNIY